MNGDRIVLYEKAEMGPGIKYPSVLKALSFVWFFVV